MPLHIDARPKNLNTFFGNKEIVESLKSIIKDKNRPRTFLLQGATGNGKTTLARILAEEFGCKSFDMIELNASNTRGIDTIREIIQQSGFVPMYGESKCYILDESHQLTAPAQEALLKVIEDSPVNTYFFLLTTNPARIISTIRNRCAIYSVSPLTLEEMDDFIEYITMNFLGQKVLQREIIDLIIDNARGCPRKALIYIEQIKGLETLEQAKKIVSDLTVEAKEFIELCRKVVSRDSGFNKWGEIIKIYKGLNIEPEKVRKAILGYLKSCLMNTVDVEECKRFSEMLEIFSDNVYEDGEPKLLNMLYKSTNL